MKWSWIHLACCTRDTSSLVRWLRTSTTVSRISTWRLPRLVYIQAKPDGRGWELKLALVPRPYNLLDQLAPQSKGWIVNKEYANNLMTLPPPPQPRTTTPTVVVFMCAPPRVLGVAPHYPSGKLRPSVGTVLVRSFYAPVFQPLLSRRFLATRNCL